MSPKAIPGEEFYSIPSQVAVVPSVLGEIREVVDDSRVKWE